MARSTRPKQPVAARIATGNLVCGFRKMLRCVKPALILLGGSVAFTNPATAQGPGPIQIANQTAKTVQSNSTQLQIYDVPSELVGPVGANLQVQFHQNPQVSVTTDPKTGKLMVMAPEAVHRQIAPQINRLLVDAKTARTSDKGLNVGSYQQQTMNLRNLSWRELEDAVTKLAGNKLTLTTERNGELAIFRITNSAGMQDVMQVDRRLNQINMLGTGPSATGWLQVLHSLDAGQVDQQRATHVVPLAPAEPRRVKRAIQLISTTMPQDPQAQGATRLNQNPPGPDDQVTAMGTLDTLSAESGLFGDVQIEFIEEIDLVIVRGSKRDVERTLEVIDKIKNQADETQPEIEVLPLEHANSQAVEALVTKLYADIYATRQGPISITALVQPNSLLLIGRREVVDSVRELVKKIDVPLDATNQLKVVRLLHASSVDAEETIRGFFVENPSGTGGENRVALGTRVRILADYRTNSLILHGAPREIEEVEKLIKEIDVESTTATNEIRVFPLKHSLAEEMQTVLQSVIDGTSEGGGDNAATPPSSKLTIVGKSPVESGILAGIVVTADPATNALVVRAPTNTMELIEELIRQLDKLPEAEARIKVFHVEHGDATQLAQLLQQLFGLQVTAGQSTTGGLLGLNAGAGNIAQGLTAGGESSLVQLRITPDVRTNSIIVSGGPSDLEVIEVLLLRLDEDGVVTRRTEVVWLRNTNATDVATALNQFLQLQRQATTQVLLSNQSISAFEQVDREVFIVAETLTNSLVISATPRYFESMMKVIEKLDRRPPLVAIQVLIAQVTLSDQFELGTELGIQDALLFDRRVSSAGTLASPGFNVVAPGVISDQRVAGQGLGTFGMGRTSSTLGYGGLVLSAASDSVNVLFRALQDANRLQVLSRPQIMTMDNRQASVLVGQMVPRVQSTTQTQFGQTFNAPDTPVGLQLNVWPRVNQDGLILMPLQVTNSNLGAIDQGVPVGIGADGSVIRSPIINTTTASTTISAYSGQTVVFAGLIQKNRQSVSRKVPFLGSIPVLGAAFRFESETESRTELLVVLTPRIVQTDEDYEIYKQVESSRMSWCLSDILNIHGDVGLNGGNGLWGTPRGPVIFPDLQPTTVIDNTLPGESIQEPIIIDRNGVESGYPAPQPAPTMLNSTGDQSTSYGPASGNVQQVGYQTALPNGLIENRPLPQGSGR